MILLNLFLFLRLFLMCRVVLLILLDQSSFLFSSTFFTRCIFGELLTREALFQGDRKESPDVFQKRQVEIVFNKIGKPTVGGPNEVVVEGKPRTTWPEVVYLPFWKEIEV